MNFLGRLKGLSALVGGTRATKRLATFSVVVGTVALSGSCGACSWLNPEPAPPTAPTAPPTMPPAPTPAPTSPSEPGTTGGPAPEAPESKCVFVRPKIVRAIKALPEAFIVGGTPALPGEGPWMVSLQTADRWHFCAGAIFNGRWILTASHCVEAHSTMIAVVGRQDLRTQEGWAFQVTTEHVMQPAELVDGEVVPLYNPDTLDWDVALIDLAQDAGVPSLDLYTGKLRAIDPDIDPVKPQPKKAQTFGWGRQWAGGPASPVLLKLQSETPIVAQQDCWRAYPTLTPRMVCSDRRGSGSCQGDSGGPILVEGLRVGIVSFGRGCADDWPGVYAYVGAELDPWETGIFGYSDEISEWVHDCAT